MKALSSSIVLLIVLATVTCGAQDSQSTSRYYFPSAVRFISVQVGTHSLGGDDFNGTTYYADAEHLYIVPQCAPGKSYGIGLEFKEKWYGGNLAYTHASQEYGWGGFTNLGTTTNHVINCDLKVTPLPGSAIQPFALAGFFWNLLRVEDGKYNARSEDLEDETMYGPGINLGGGLDYFIGGKLKLSLGLTWHRAHYGAISGVELDEGLSVSGTNYYLSTGFMLGSGD